MLDAIEPAARVLVEFGYDRTIPFGQPTPAQLVGRDDLDQLNRDLMAAIEQGRTILDAGTAREPVRSVTALPTRLARPEVTASAQQSRTAGRVRTPEPVPAPASRPRR